MMNIDEAMIQILGLNISDCFVFFPSLLLDPALKTPGHPQPRWQLPLSATFALVAAKGSPELLALVDFVFGKRRTKKWNKIVLLCRKKNLCVCVCIYLLDFILFFLLVSLVSIHKSRAFLKSIALQLLSSSFFLF